MSLEFLPKVFTNINDGGLRISSIGGAPKITIIGVTNNKERNAAGEFIIKKNDPVLIRRQSQIDRLFTNADGRPSELKLNAEEAGAGGGSVIEMVATSRTVAHLAKSITATDTQIPVTHVFSNDLTAKDLTPPTGPLVKAAGVAYGTSIYLAGGIGADGNAVSTIWKYDTVADSWTNIGVLPHNGGTGAFDLMGTVITPASGDRIYFLGGSIGDDQEYTAGPNVVWINPVDDTVTPVSGVWDSTAAASAVFGGVAFGDSRNIYVAGGRRKGSAGVATDVAAFNVGGAAGHDLGDYIKFTNAYGKTVMLWLDTVVGGGSVEPTASADIKIPLLVNGAALPADLVTITTDTVNGAQADTTFKDAAGVNPGSIKLVGREKKDLSANTLTLIDGGVGSATTVLWNSTTLSVTYDAADVAGDATLVAAINSAASQGDPNAWAYAASVTAGVVDPISVAADMGGVSVDATETKKGQAPASSAVGIVVSAGTGAGQITLTSVVQGTLPSLNVDLFSGGNAGFGVVGLVSNATAWTDGTDPDVRDIMYWEDPTLLANADPGSANGFKVLSSGKLHGLTKGGVYRAGGAQRGSEAFIFGGLNSSDAVVGPQVLASATKLVLNAGTPSSTSVTPLPDMPTARYAHDVVCIVDAIRNEFDLLLTGGLKADGTVLDSTLRYDKDGATKYLNGPGVLKTPLAYHVASTVADRLYVTGGSVFRRYDARGLASSVAGSDGFVLLPQYSYAQSFTVHKDMKVRKIRLRLNRSGMVDGSLTAQIQTNAAGIPSGGPLGNATSDSVSIGTLTDGVSDWVEFKFQSDIIIPSKTVFWLILSVAYSSTGVGFLNDASSQYLKWDGELRKLADNSACAVSNGGVWTASALPCTLDLQVDPTAVDDFSMLNTQYNLGLGALADSGFPSLFPYLIQVDREVMLVTSSTTTREGGADVDVFVVSRGQNGTSASLHNKNVDVYEDPNALFDQIKETFRQLENHPTDLVLLTPRATADTRLLDSAAKNFAWELARFAWNKTQNDDTTLGFIGVEPSFSSVSDVPTLNRLEQWVADLESYNAVNFLNEPVWEIGDGVTDVNDDGIPDKYAFWATSDALIPVGSPPAKAANIIKDQKGNPQDLGAYISVVALEGIFVTNAGREKFPVLRQYNANGYAAYAGQTSSLQVQSGTTNKVIGGLSPIRKLSGPQANRLVGTRYVTGLSKSKGYVVAKDVTFAFNISQFFRSDFVLLTTIRITQATIDLIRQVGEPFIGESNSGSQRRALQQEIEIGLMKLKSAGAIQDFDFNISTTSDQQVLGEATIDLAIVPAFELLQLNLNFSLAREV